MSTWSLKDTSVIEADHPRLAELMMLAEKYGYYVWRFIVREPSQNGLSALIVLGFEPHNECFEAVPLGWAATPDEAIDNAIILLEANKMDLYKNVKLFPYIKGAMLKDVAVKLTLSKDVDVVELQGGDARVELSFTNHPKKAVVNRTQAQNIINMYGSETNDWQGKEVILYGEHGKWFGKFQWGVRVWDTTSQDTPPASVQKVLRKKAQANGRPHEVVPFEKSLEDGFDDADQPDLVASSDYETSD